MSVSDEEEDTCSSSEEEEEEEGVGVDESKVQELENKILANPYDYTAHTHLLKLLDSGGDVARCREVRERMSGLFPLTDEMWLDWIRQERLFLSLDPPRVRDTLRNLYSRAVQDYSSVRLWCQYCSDVTTVLEYSEEKTRELFEQALSDVGLHVTKGSELWEQYRQYEDNLLHTIRDKLKEEGESSDKEFLQDLYNKQRSRVDELFRRQLAVPSCGLEYLMSEYKSWLGEDTAVPAHLHNRYLAAIEKRDTVLPYEEALENTVPPHEEEYYYYIEHERKHGDPARVVCLMERALSDNPLNSTRWLDFLHYLDQVLKVKSVTLRAYSRAVRNVPWVVEIWVNYMLAQQRYQLHFSHIDETLEEALRNGFQEPASYIALWKCYLCCHWRQERFKPLKTNGSSEEHLDNNPLNQAFERAVNFISQNYGEEGDPTGELTRMMAECEGVREDVSSCRLLMSGLFESKTHKEQSALWLEWVSLELRFGTVEEARRVFQRAVQCSTDKPELIQQRFLNFESIHGTLETYDNAALKCRRLQKRTDEKRAKELEKKKLQSKKSDSKGKSKHAPKEDSNKTKLDSKDKQSNRSKKRKISSEASPQVAPKQRKQTDQTPDKPTFQAPEKPAFPKKPVSDSGEIDKSKYPLTIFVSNLSYSATEADLNDTFKHVGNITDIRLVKSVNNKSRGFGYIEFGTREEVMTALEMDRVPVLGRPCYVSECKEKDSGTKEGFKYKTGLETHKLFVNNLPYTTTETELRDVFTKIGHIKTLRMVTTKSGKFKGYAYVEFTKSDEAKRAVLELNDTMVGDRKMSVAISNPPGKSSDKSLVKHFDSGLVPEKSEDGFKRKVKMNFMVPRVISKPKTTDSSKRIVKKTPSCPDTSSAPESSSSISDKVVSSSDKVVSNSDKLVPRQMLSNTEFSKLFDK